MKLKTGDTVKIITGKDKGKTGKIARVIRDENRIVVEGINVRKKHLRPKKQGQKGQIAQIPAPFNLSNAALVCPSCQKPARVGFKIEGGKKTRFCKKCETAI
ncbi:50S ribosomal protein L24 [Candidatus Parcubacteria bacterium]|nr:MAG: 50S ribosomal protein L24 [Candidatus Parcubacteria bacterium]